MRDRVLLVRGARRAGEAHPRSALLQPEQAAQVERHPQDAWHNALPSVVEAVFFSLEALGEYGEWKARDVHLAFRQAYGSQVDQTPLVSYDRSSPDAPFAIVDNDSWGR